MFGTPLHSPAVSSRGSSPGRSMNKLRKPARESSVSSISVLDIPAPVHLKDDLNKPYTAPPTTKPDTRANDFISEDLKEPKPYEQVKDACELPPPQSSRPKRGHPHIIAYTRPQPLSEKTNEGKSVFKSQSLSRQINVVLASSRMSKHSPEPAVAVCGRSTSQRHTRGAADKPRPIIIGGLHDIATMTPPASPASTDTDIFESMQTHRKSYAAEMGQLLPKAGRCSPRHTASATTGNISESISTLSLPRVNSWPAISPESQPQPGSLDPKAVPFRAFVEKHPPPSKNFKAPPSAWSDRTQELMTDKLLALRKKTEALPSEENIRPSIERTLSLENKVTRRVNNGFEIHPAGSLEQPKPPKEFGMIPCVDGGASFDPDRRARKLQKRDRPRSKDSRGSSSQSSIGQVEGSPKTLKDRPALTLRWTGLKSVLWGSEGV